MAAVFPGFTTLKVKVLGKGFVDGALAQGMGRHDRHEVQELGLQDLKALSAFLGKMTGIFICGMTPYSVMGDSQYFFYVMAFCLAALSYYLRQCWFIPG